MKIKCYDDEINGKLVFETKIHLPNPITSFLIEKGVKEVPADYSDSSSLKPTESDYKLLSDYLKENPIYNKNNKDKTKKYEIIMFFLGIRTDAPTIISISTLRDFKTIDISYFKNFYKSLYDEHKEEMKRVKILEISE